MAKVNLLLQVFPPYLTADQADAIRAAIEAMKPRVYLVMEAWPWLEARGITGEGAARIIEMVRDCGVTCRELQVKQKVGRARVQVSQTMAVV